MNNQQLARAIANQIGPTNILEAEHCMTRLRIKVNTLAIKKEDFSQLDGVKGVLINQDEIQIILGPGKAGQVAIALNAVLKESSLSETSEMQKKAVFGDGQDLRDAIRRKNSSSAAKTLLRKIGHIFIPLIPAFIGCGLLTGSVALLLKLLPDLAGNPLIQYLKLTGGSIFVVLNAFVGLYSCREFGGTPALGGAIAGLLSAPGLADINLFGTTLVPGRGGIFASLLIGITTAKLELRLRKIIPEVMDLFVTPFLTLSLIALASIFVFQPLGGFFSEIIGYYTVRAIQIGSALTGFALGGIFLPIVMAGIHHGITPIHADMLSSQGITPLLPIVAMAGCGQVGASFAVYCKTKNKALKHTILSSLPVGIIGIGEPLIYGVTLPLGKPFLGACLGGACGGAWQAFHEVGAYTMGISGLPLAAATNHIFFYLTGVMTAYVAGFICTWFIGFDDPPEKT